MLCEAWWKVWSSLCGMMGSAVNFMPYGYLHGFNNLVIYIFIYFIMFKLLFFYFNLLRVFHFSLSDSKCPWVSGTLLSFLADLNNAIVWMVSTRPLISKSSSSCTNPLVTALSVSITIDITITFMFHSFSVLFAFFQFYHVVCQNGKVHYLTSSFLFFFFLFFFFFFFFL